MARKRATAVTGGHSRVAKALWPQVAELRAAGKTNKEIAQAIDRLESAVCRTLQQPEVIADIERIQAERRAILLQDIRSAATIAFATILRIATGEGVKDEVSLRAAQDICDRAGLAAPKAVELSGPAGAPVRVVTMTPDDLVQMTPAQLRALATVEEESEDGQP